MECLWPLLAARTTYLDRYVLQGGVMMYALVPTAVLGLGFVLQGLISLRGGRMVRRDEMEEMARLAAKGDAEGVQRAALGGRTVAARVVAATVAAWRETGRDDATLFIREEIARRFRVIHPLVVIFNIAPYLGILGTVTGLLEAFNVYATVGTPSIADLGTGMTQALLTTIWGLCIAVPAYLFYQVFRARLIRYEEDLLPEAAGRVLGALRTAAGGAAAGTPDRAGAAPPSRYVIGDSGGFRLQDTVQPTPAPSDPQQRQPTLVHREHPTEEFGRHDRPTLAPLAEEDGRALHPENPTEEIRLP